MIDYLELLLGEEREDGLSLFGRQVVLEQNRAVRSGDWAAEEARREGVETLPQEEGTGGLLWRAEAAGEGPSVADALAVAEGTAEGAVWLAERAEQGARGSALYEALRRADRVAQPATGGRDTVTVTLPGETAGRQTADWSALDRAVQRDARRYDGGFPLY